MDHGITVNGSAYGPGAWLYIGTRPVTFIGLEQDGSAWYIRGHVDGGFAAVDELSDEGKE